MTPATHSVDANPVDERVPLRSLLVYGAQHALVIYAGIVIVPLVLSAALAAAGKYMSGIIPAQETLWQIADFIISLGLITLLFAMIFKILPDVKIVWRDVWFGTVWHGGAGGCALAGVVINSSFGQGCQNAAAPILSDHFKNCTGG